MSYRTHKRTSEGKARTIERRQIRTAKYGVDSRVNK